MIVEIDTLVRKVSTIALSATLSYLAIGLGDGTVILYRHLDQSIYSTSGSLSTLPKPRVIHESPTEPITGLGFREPTEDTPNIYLFIVTTKAFGSFTSWLKQPFPASVLPSGERYSR